VMPSKWSSRGTAMWSLLAARLLQRLQLCLHTCSCDHCCQLLLLLHWSCGCHCQWRLIATERVTADHCRQCSSVVSATACSPWVIHAQSHTIPACLDLLQ
jgi:hypothetical protein